VITRIAPDIWGVIVYLSDGSEITTTTNHLTQLGILHRHDRVTFLPTVCGTALGNNTGATLETTADVHPAALIQGF
jgi:hypothetical protein